jgi:hypothetical protein
MPVRLPHFEISSTPRERAQRRRTVRLLSPVPPLPVAGPR